MKSEFKDKKVLLIGLGILGGGVSIANWLLKQGAKLSITDSKPKEYFKESIKKIKGQVKYFFENCGEKNITDADIIVINQAISQNNPLVLLAEKFGKPVYNESRIFYENCTKPIIAITGTRGKTTVTNWTAHIIGRRATVAGNSSSQPPLKILPKTKNKQCEIVVNEIPSFQLERFRSVPEIALITNIFVDHLNRHGTLENYALSKANVFKNQTEKNKLILNYNNEWTDFFLKQNPKAQIWFFSLDKLPENKNGIYYQNGSVYLQTGTEKPKKILDIKDFENVWGRHNVANLLSAILVAYLADEKFSDIQKKIKAIPQVKYRQELVKDFKNTKIINDTSATSPEGGMAAIEHFGFANCILIAGGTDAGLEYHDWVKTLIKFIPLKNIILLEGSATKKMLTELSKYIDISKISVENSLDECVKLAFIKISNINKESKKEKVKSVILFSPAAKSFEKFKNEFDRGEQFNKLIK